MVSKSVYKHDSEGFNEKFKPSKVVTIQPFVNSPVYDELVKLTKWRVNDHRFVVDLPDDMPTEVNSEAMAEVIANSTWFLRSALPAIFLMEQSYSEKYGTANIKLVGYGITGLTPGSVDLSAWQLGKPKPKLYPSTIGDRLNDYFHLFTVPASGRSDNSMKKKANHVAMNKLDRWTDGEPFSPTVSAVATYAIAAGIKALAENRRLNLLEIEKAILSSQSAVQFQGAIATVILHGVARWNSPGIWSGMFNDARVVPNSDNSAQRGLTLKGYSADYEWVAKYIKVLIKDLPNALSFQMQKAIRALEWDGSTQNDRQPLLSK